MDNYTYSSSHASSGDSSPPSHEIECETAVAVAVSAWDEVPPQPPTAVAASLRVKLMCSYGGRIQPRSHDNQLSYVGGNTKILAVDRSIRYPSIIAKLSALSFSSSDDVILKYQLPGEDLDALISVTNDEDLEHMLIEYDRLHRTGSKPVPKLRLFLFSVMGKGSQDRACFADPPPPAVSTPKEGPDYLFGLEAAATTTNFFPPVAEVKDPAAEKAGIEAARSVETEAVVPTKTELQMHVQELQRIRIVEKQQQQQQQQNGNDETLFGSYPAEYYAPPPPVQDKAPPAPPAPALGTALPTAYWQDPHGSLAPASGPRFASFMGGDGNLYLIPTNPAVYPAGAAPVQTYYTTVQRVMPAAAYDNSPSVYGSAPPQQAKAPAGANDNGGFRAQQQHAVEVSAAGYGGGVAPPHPAVSAGAYDNGAEYAAYDNTGRPVYYAGPGATYQTVNNGAFATESMALKPSQVS